MHQQKSSLSWLDQSSIGLMLNAPKSEMQQKYEELFKECSQYRMKIRQLQQDNDWLTSVNQGLNNQCNILKDLLSEKKQMVVEVNTQLRIANDQISRLEDLLAQKGEQTKNLETEIMRIQNQGKQKGQAIKKMQQQMKMKNIEIQSLKKQFEDAKMQRSSVESVYQSKQRAYIQQVQQRVFEVLNKCSSPQKSPSKKANRSGQGVLGELVAKIQNLAYKMNEEKQKNSQLLRDKDEQIRSQFSRINILESQLKEAGELVEQFQLQSAKSNKMIKQYEQRIQSIGKSASKNLQNNLTMFQISMDKILRLLQPLLKTQQGMVTKLKQLIKTNKNHYEIDIVIEQLKLIIQKQINFNYDITRLRKQLKQKDNKIVLLQQQYENIKLKHLCLQRQYEAVVDDNRRVLKFNQLSRFRTDRNFRTDRQSQDISAHFFYSSSGLVKSCNPQNKENANILSNLRQNHAYRK